MLAGLRPILLACLTVMLSGSAMAREVHVPEELQSWVAWVLQDREYRQCPLLFGDRGTERRSFVCAWPEPLELRVDAAGGRFTQGWTVYATEEWIPLPGNEVHWPQRVTADGRAIPVVMRNGIPSARLAPGRYELAGRFEWRERPSTLAIPAATGLLRLSVDGVRVPRPDWGRTAVWLGDREQQRAVQDAVTVQVFRLVADDVPTELTTMFRVEVAGSVREELVGPALPEGFVPLAIASALPARLEPDGNLRLQLRPGSWEVTLNARGPGVLDAVTLPSPVHNLPDVEIWSYRSNDRLRVTAPVAERPVDPAQVSVPAPWRELPAFRLEPGDSLGITERSRGKVAVDNDLFLARRLWLDFNGSGYVFSDSVGGTMRSGWRLDMAPPYALLSAAEAGENLLITLGDEPGLAGVELRRTDVDLYAVGRAVTRGAMPVTGWRTHFNRVEAELNLPPGHKLIAAPGVDRAPASWVERWRLLDLFVLLIITVAAARLYGRNTGALAFVALALSLHEFGAPAWSWLNMLAAIVLVRVAPTGRLLRYLKAYRAFSLALLLLLLVPFAVTQIRIALYPQLEDQYAVAGGLLGLEATPYGAGDARRLEQESMPMADRPARGPEAPAATEEVMVTAQKVAPSVRFARYAPNAIVQAGPGRPSWRWNSYQLSWGGPVDAERTLRLIVMPRWLVSAVRLLEVLLLVAFAAVFALEIFRRKWNWPWGAAGAPAALAALSVAVLFASPPASADTPSPSILEELEKRLLAPAPCAPNCAEFVDARVIAGGDALTIELELHALEEVAVPLPGSLRGWRPERFQIDRAPAAQLFRDGNDVLWARVGAGRHELTLDGPIPPVDSLELPFPAPPRVIRAQSDAWFIAGIQDQRLLSGSLQLTRLKRQGERDTAARWESGRFPVFVRVERQIALDLDWTATTTVHRIAPQQGALTLNIPLLEGESVLSEDFTVEGRELLVTMSPDQRAVSWRSMLPRQSSMTLEAREGGPWKEVWRFAIGSVWHAEFGGVPESEVQYDVGDTRVAEFYPRGGETLTLVATRPDASPGATLAFDYVQAHTVVGARSESVQLTLAYRSTRGAQHVIRLPEGAEIGSVTIDGASEPLRPDGRELTVPIVPGEHNVDISWRTPKPIGYTEHAPAGDLGAPAGNIHLIVELPRNRWVLATGGPRLGPAVMYWSELAALLLVAVILGRVRITPLTTRDWVLLGLGFSTFSWYVLGVVVFWLLASGLRRDLKPDLTGWRFNALQVAFALLTVAALASIVGSLPQGLLGTPDMHVAGNGSAGNTLRWFADRSDGPLPDAWVFSLPLWTYKALILAWALWLSFALLRWLPWVWQCFTAQGLWQSRRGVELSRPSGREP